MTFILLGHVLGDFYLQNRRMPIHAAIYAACMGAAYIAGMEFSVVLLPLWLASSALHLLIEYLKRRLLMSERGGRAAAWLRGHSIIAGQTAHFISLVALWGVWGNALTQRTYTAPLPASPEQILLGLLLILRPAGMLIESGELWDFSRRSAGAPDDEQKGAGKMIGYLERTIVFFFLLVRQYGAIAFVLTAKSVARYKEIEKEKTTAEYYLIGTLLSMVSVFAVTLLLGLI